MIGPRRGVLSRISNRAYGVAFLLALVVLVGLSVATFQKKFTPVVMVTLMAERGVERDMGTPLDSFPEPAQPRHEERFFASGELTKSQLENRHLLRNMMEQAGFTSIPHEWWHYNATTFAEAKAKYSILE